MKSMAVGDFDGEIFEVEVAMRKLGLKSRIEIVNLVGRRVYEGRDESCKNMVWRMRRRWWRRKSWMS